MRRGAVADLFFQLLVAIIEIIAEVELSVARIRGEVDDVDGNLLRERYGLVVAATAHRTSYSVRRPAEHELRELVRVLETNASVTRRAIGLQEERLLRRVV